MSDRHPRRRRGPGVTDLGPHNRQVVVARSEEHRAAEAALAAARSPDRRHRGHAVRGSLDRLHRRAAGGVRRSGRRRARPPVSAPSHPAGRAAPPLRLRRPQRRDVDEGQLLMNAPIQRTRRRRRSGRAIRRAGRGDGRHLLGPGPPGVGVSPTLADWALAPNSADVLDTVVIAPDERRRRRRELVARLNQHGSGSFERLAIFVASHHPPNLRAAGIMRRGSPIRHAVGRLPPRRQPRQPLLDVGSPGQRDRLWAGVGAHAGPPLGGERRGVEPGALRGRHQPEADRVLRGGSPRCLDDTRGAGSRRARRRAPPARRHGRRDGRCRHQVGLRPRTSIDEGQSRPRPRRAALRVANDRGFLHRRGRGRPGVGRQLEEAGRTRPRPCAPDSADQGPWRE